MAEITTKITPLPVVAGRFDVDFIETADKFLNQLPNTCVEMNNFASQANSLRDEVNSFKDTTYNYMNTTLNYKNTAYSYKEEAINATNLVKNYVIPEEATYSQEALETALNGILNRLTAHQAEIAILKDNIDIKNLQQQIDELPQKIANVTEPILLSASIYLVKNATYTFKINNYKDGDVYKVKTLNIDAISDAIVSIVNGYPVVAINTSENDANGIIAVTRIRESVERIEYFRFHIEIN